VKKISRKTSITATFCNKVPAFKLISILRNEVTVTLSSQIFTQERRKMITRSLHVFLFRIQNLHTIVIGNIQTNSSFVLFLQTLQIFGGNESFL
jgi:hypothetical protein